MHQGRNGLRAAPCSPAEAAGGKEAAGLTSERKWKAATGAAKVGRWLASIPHPAPPRSAYVSFVPPATLLEKLLLLRSVPAARLLIGKLAVVQLSHSLSARAEHRQCADCPDAAVTVPCSRWLQCYWYPLCEPSKLHYSVTTACSNVALPPFPHSGQHGAVELRWYDTT